MPMNSLRARGDNGLSSVSEIGFYHDGGAVAYARRTAGSGTVEVWRNQELIAVVDEVRPTHMPVHAPLSHSA